MEKWESLWDTTLMEMQLSCFLGQMLTGNLTSILFGIIAFYFYAFLWHTKRVPTLGLFGPAVINLFGSAPFLIDDFPPLIL